MHVEHRMKMTSVPVLVLSLALFSNQVLAQGKPAAPAAAPAKPVVTANDEEAAEPLPTWAEQKARLQKLEVKFRDKKLSKDAKVKFLPESNALLSEMQEIKFSGKEKADQIATTVSFLSASIDADFANSNTNTVYLDFKANQKAYETEIAKLPSKDAAKKIAQAFKEWGEFEKDAEKTQSESDEE
jgi:hypothetical protein